MTYQPILDEVKHLHGVSGRLEELADQHPRATEELLTIAGSVRNVATLLAVLVAVRGLAANLHVPPGLEKHAKDASDDTAVIGDQDTFDHQKTVTQNK